MTDSGIPAEALRAAAEAIERELMSDSLFDGHVEADEALAKAALEAAAPLLVDSTRLARIMRAEGDAAKLRGAFEEVIDIIADATDALDACVAIEKRCRNGCGPRPA